MTAAARQRRHRARRASGKRVYRVCIDEAALEVALQAHDHLSPMTDDPAEVERALNRMVAQFVNVTRNGPRE